MNKMTTILKKTIALIVGMPLLIVGLILIPLPGPGVITTIAALFILSLGFEGAKPYLHKAKAKVKPMIDKFKEQYEKLKEG